MVQSPTPILWLIDSMAADAGTEQQVLQLGRRLNRDKFQLEMATLESSSRDVEIAKLFPVNNFTVGRLFSPAGILQIIRLAAHIHKHGIKVVHGFTFKSSIAAVMAGSLARAPIVITSRRNLGYYYTRRIISIVKQLNSQVTRVVANSEAAKTMAMTCEDLPASKIDVLYNGVDCERFERPGDPTGAVPLPFGKRLVGVVANYRPVKDLPLFLKSAVIVARAVPDVSFLLIGAGPQQRELEALASELGIRDRVIFTGGKGSVPWYLQNLTVACLSSASEGFSNSILEYMASGLPVVATDVGGNCEAVVHGETGYLVSDRDPVSFAEYVITLLNDRAQASRMGLAGKRVCNQRFPMHEAVRQLETYYEALIQTGAPPVLQPEKTTQKPRTRHAVVAG